MASKPEIDRLSSLRKQVKRLQDEDPDIRSKAVHKVRVLCRRLEAMCDLSLAQKKSKEVKKFRLQIKMLRKSLGKIREVDVHLKLWKSIAPRNNVSKMIFAALNQRHIHAWRKFWKKWKSKDLKNLIRSLHDCHGGFPDLKTLGHSRRLLQPTLKNILHLLDSQPEHFHKLRLLIKHLRYSLEHLLLMKPQTSAQIKELQERLGSLQDLQTLQLRLIKISLQMDDSLDTQDRRSLEKIIDEIQKKVQHQTNTLKTDAPKWQVFFRKFQNQRSS